MATAPALFGYHPVVVTSGSMDPAIRTADIVVTSGTNGRDLDVGTVINHDAAGQTTLHRIVSVTTSGYRTAGDANGVTDSITVTPESVRGVGVVVVPFVGRPYVWLHSGQWLKLSLALVAIALTIHTARPAWLTATRS